MSYKEQIDLNRVPQHVAIIMDGNGRWAKQRGHERSFGHQAGAETVHIIAEEAARMGVKYLTLYTFSTENWNRPETEISALMGLLFDSIEEETFMKNNISFRVIGRQTACQCTNPFEQLYRTYLSQYRHVSRSGLELFLTLGANRSNTSNSRRGKKWDSVSRANRRLYHQPASGYQFHARSRFADTDGRRNPFKQLPIMAMCLFGTLLLRHLLARLPRRRILPCHL